MSYLGYSVSLGLIERKLKGFHETPHDEVFVADLKGKVVGCISCHITSLFHQEGASGRITSLVINPEFRSKGIGGNLVKKAEEYFKSMGCIKSEVTSGDHRKEAHKFYIECGYQEDERRFIKNYS